MSKDSWFLVLHEGTRKFPVHPHSEHQGELSRLSCAAEGRTRGKDVPPALERRRREGSQRAEIQALLFLQGSQNQQTSAVNDRMCRLSVVNLVATNSSDSSWKGNHSLWDWTPWTCSCLHSNHHPKNTLKTIIGKRNSYLLKKKKMTEPSALPKWCPLSEKGRSPER